MGIAFWLLLSWLLVVMMVGVHDEVMFAAESVKKEQKNKRKTQKLGWL